MHIICLAKACICTSLIWPQNWKWNSSLRVESCWQPLNFAKQIGIRPESDLVAKSIPCLNITNINPYKYTVVSHQWAYHLIITSNFLTWYGKVVALGWSSLGLWKQFKVHCVVVSLLCATLFIVSPISCNDLWLCGYFLSKDSDEHHCGY